MKQRYLIIVLCFILLVLEGCVQEVVCNRPYILVGADCCLDQNNNGICDKDEVYVQPVTQPIISPKGNAEETMEDLILKNEEDYQKNAKELNLIKTQNNLKIKLEKAGNFNLITDEGDKSVFRVDISVTNEGNEEIDLWLIDITPKVTFLLDEINGEQVSAIYPYLPYGRFNTRIDYDNYPNSYNDVTIYPGAINKGFVIFTPTTNKGDFQFITEDLGQLPFKFEFTI